MSPFDKAHTTSY